MREGAGKIVVLCDTEEEYAQLMAEFIRKHRNLPWELHAYTDTEALVREEKREIEMLVIAESAYSPGLETLCPKRTVILNESGVMRWENVSYVDKYQEAESVLKQLLGMYVEISNVPLPRLRGNYKTVFIGNYSPVKRSMQTSFAITMSQMLAEEHSTLYLNFEHYAGIAELLPDAQTLDMADLLYFVNAEKEKFRLRMQTMLKHRGNLDYIPPMRSGQNLLTVTAQEWMELLEKIEELEEYEYVVLDLSESMQGLFEILRLCTKVYTLIREDRIAKAKLLQYEQVLSMYEYGDVRDKTKCLNLSHIRSLPGELEQLTKGDMADLVRKLLREMREEGGKENQWNMQN